MYTNIFGNLFFGSSEGQRFLTGSYHLQRCQVFLPPQESLILGSHCGEQIVCVHHNVHERVQQTEECTMATYKTKNGIQINYIMISHM